MAKDGQQTGPEEPRRIPPEAVTTSDTPRPEETQGAGNAEAPNGADGDPAPRSDNRGRKRARGAERRINRMSRKLEQLEQANAQMAQELEAARQRSASPPPAKPRLTDFDTPDEYAEAYAEWKGQTKSKPPEPKPNQDRQSQPKGAVPQEDVEDFIEYAKDTLGDEAFKKANDAAKEAEMPLSAAMLKWLVKDDEGPQVFAELARRPRLAKRIANMSAAAARDRLEQMAAELDDDSSETPAEPTPKASGNNSTPRKRTKAPAVTPRVEGTNAPAPTEWHRLASNPDASGKDLEAYMRAARQRDKEKLGRR